MTRKTTFFEGWSWFKFNNLGLALGMTLKFYTRVAKGLKLKFRKIWDKFYVCRSYRGKTGKGAFLTHLPPPSLSILNRVKIYATSFCHLARVYTYQRSIFPIFLKATIWYPPGRRSLANLLISRFLLVLVSLLDVRLCQMLMICQVKNNSCQLSSQDI